MDDDVLSVQQFRRDLIESVRHITEELTEIMNSTIKRVSPRPGNALAASSTWLAVVQLCRRHTLRDAA